MIALEDRCAIPSLLTAIETALDRKEFRQGMESITPEERVILAVEAVEREVNNGGHSQLFPNSSSLYVPILVQSLLSIDCPETAELEREAIAALNPSSLTQEAIGIAINNDVEQRDDKLNKLDDLYFNTHESIALSLWQYIRQHQDQIILPQS